MTASVLKQDPNTKSSNQRLFILTRTHSMRIMYNTILYKSILCVRVKINKRSFEPFCVCIYAIEIRLVIEPQNILFAGAYGHFSARKFYRLEQ